MSKRHHHKSRRDDKKESHKIQDDKKESHKIRGGKKESRRERAEKKESRRERADKKESRRERGGEKSKCKKHQFCSTNHQECGIVRYPKMGACCVDGLCSIQEEQECLRGGGYWMGTDTRCWEVTCPDAPLGACIVPGGQCGLTREYECPGMWMGPFTSCFNALVPYGGQMWNPHCSGWGEGNQGWRQINGAPPWIARNVGSNALIGRRAWPY